MATKEIVLRIPAYTLGRLDRIATKKKSTRDDVLTELIENYPLQKELEKEIAELTPLLHELDRADKLRVLLLLVYELAQEEGALLQPGMVYPIWSPYDSFEAANTLLNVLKEAENTPSELLHGV